MIKPDGLKYGSKLGIISPASPNTKIDTSRVFKILKKLGFKAKISKTCYKRYGYLAGKDALRAKELNKMFGDETIDAILCMRGGYGSPRILELLDYDLIKKNPKVFIGYSDITALHLAISKYCNLVTFHGPMALDIIEDFDIFSKKSLYNSIYGGKFKPNLVNPAGKRIITINEGIAEGKIIGGNLSLITSSLGTPYEIDTEGKVLFIEEVNEEPYRIDRMLTQLKLSGKLDAVAGIILGDFNDCKVKNEKRDKNLSLKEIINDIIKPLKKPAIYNFQSGHCKPMVTLPFGVKSRLDASNKELVILEKPTKL